VLIARYIAPLPTTSGSLGGLAPGDLRSVVPINKDLGSVTTEGVTTSSVSVTTSSISVATSTVGVTTSTVGVNLGLSISRRLRAVAVEMSHYNS
jgi:hypothetical protein